MNELYIRFMAPVIPQTVAQLFQLFDHATQNKVERIHLLLSSPGGSVFHGLSIYNYLKGTPFDTHAYNFGSVDSIGIIIFCAGSRRLCVPHARFLIHPVQFNIQGNAQFDEKQLDEHLKSLKIDQENIARVIADTTGKELHKVEEDMINRTTLSPQQAKDYGLVHEIQSVLFPADAQLAVIGEPIQTQAPRIVHASSPIVQSFTRSRDLDFVTLPIEEKKTQT
jgi:ATP-dependent Clp endopeptidase proteolytic subunit ClpP